MGKLHLVCLPVPLEGERLGPDGDKTANKRFAELAAKLRAVGVDTCQISVPKLPAMSPKSLEDVIDGIRSLELTLLEFCKELGGGVPSDAGHKRALSLIQEFVWDAIQFPTDKRAQVMAIPGKVKERVQLLIREHGEKKSVCRGLTARADALRQNTGSVLERELSLMVSPKDKERLLEEEKSANEELAGWSFGTLDKADVERIRLLSLRASAESAARNGEHALFMAFVAAPEDRSAERRMREELEEVAGSENILSAEEWKTFLQADMYDGSDNFPYLSVSFDM